MRQICVLAPKSPRRSGRRSIKLIQTQWMIIDKLIDETGGFPGFLQVKRLIYDQSDLGAPLTGGRRAGDGMRQIRAITTPSAQVRDVRARRWNPLAPKIAVW
jgi:hypothetical protein